MSPASDDLIALPVKRVALVGNPNSGKTSLFNAITGLRHKVGNYPGVTVEKREGSVSLPDGTSVEIIDLPGVYSLLGISLDEKVTVNELRPFSGAKTPHLDLILAVIDAGALERGLFLLAALLSLNIPVVVVLTMTELAHARGITIRSALLSRELGLPVLTPSIRTSEDRTRFLIEILANRASDSSVRQNYASEVQRLSEEGLSEEGLIEARYLWAYQITQRVQVVERTRAYEISVNIDRYCAHPLIGLLLFVLVMASLFQVLFNFASLPMELIEQSVVWVGGLFSDLLPSGVIRSLVVDGIVSGVGSVLVFVPQIFILFFLLGILEESGYLTRAAYVMDRVMRPFGLQGRAFIPLLSSFACAIPGILATRSIGGFADRMTTILIAPLMSCSARLPVYTVLISAVVPEWYVGGIFSLQGIVLLCLYFLGIISAAVVALILRLTVFNGAPSHYLMEMPPFRLPNFKIPFLQAYDRVRGFVGDAGSMILACTIILWMLAYFPVEGDIANSYAGQIGRFLEPLVSPLGYTWEIAIGIIGSFAAREVFVSTLATVYSLSGSDEETTQFSLSTALSERIADGSFTIAGVVSLMVFYVFACQCFSTLAVVRRETGGWRWPIAMFSYMTILAYVAAWLAYRGSLWIFK